MGYLSVIAYDPCGPYYAHCKKFIVKNTKYFGNFETNILGNISKPICKFNYITFVNYSKSYFVKFSFSVVVSYKSAQVNFTIFFCKFYLLYWSQSCQNILYFLQNTVIFIANYIMTNSHLLLWYFTKAK